MSLAIFTVRILDNIPLGTALRRKAVLFVRIIEKRRGVTK